MRIVPVGGPWLTRTRLCWRERRSWTGRPLPDDGLWARVAALPERQREAVVLKYVADLDHRAVAATLGTTPAMSRRLVSDALATLRLDLEELR